MMAAIPLYTDEVVEFASEWPAGKPIRLRDLTWIGCLQRVHIAVNGLVASQFMTRLCHGVYMYNPIDHETKLRLPFVMEDLFNAIHEAWGAKVMPSGAEDAKRFGIYVGDPEAPKSYWTSMEPKLLHVDGEHMLFMHGQPWRFDLPNGEAGALLRAIIWNSDHAIGAKKIAEHLGELNKDEQRTFVGSLPVIPGRLGRRLRQQVQRMRRAGEIEDV